MRQWIYPKEFRIAAPEWPPDLADSLERLAASFSETTHPGEQLPPEGIHGRTLADLGTGLWRLRQRMVEPGTDRPLEGMQRAFRHLESAWDALTQAGVKIRDHTGEPVPDVGMYGLKVVAFQPTPGIGRRKVIETIRPTISYRDQVVQVGEVIVGTPETGTDGPGQGV